MSLLELPQYRHQLLGPPESRESIGSAADRVWLARHRKGLVGYLNAISDPLDDFDWSAAIPEFVPFFEGLENHSILEERGHYYVLNAKGERRYRMRRCLGEGGFATVFELEDLMEKRRLAMKVMSDMKTIQSVLDFAHEIQLMEVLDHPNIIKALGKGKLKVGKNTYLPFVLMEAGVRSLHDLTGKLKDWSEEAIAEFMELVVLGASRGLRGFHKQASYDDEEEDDIPMATHRDVKPHNIILMPDGTVRLIDFGLAISRFNIKTIIGQIQSEPEVISGSVCFMAPEAAKGTDNVSEASDWFSLGSSVFEVLVGWSFLDQSAVSREEQLKVIDRYGSDKDYQQESLRFANYELDQARVLSNTRLWLLSLLSADESKRLPYRANGAVVCQEAMDKDKASLRRWGLVGRLWRSLWRKAARKVEQP